MKFEQYHEEMKKKRAEQEAVIMDTPTLMEEFETAEQQIMEERSEEFKNFLEKLTENELKRRDYMQFLFESTMKDIKNDKEKAVEQEYNKAVEDAEKDRAEKSSTDRDRRLYGNLI